MLHLHLHHTSTGCPVERDDGPGVDRFGREERRREEGLNRAAAVDPLDKRAKARVLAQRREECGRAETMNGAAALSDGSLEQVERMLVLAEPGVNEGEVVGRDEGRGSALF